MLPQHYLWHNKVWSQWEQCLNRADVGAAQLLFSIPASCLLVFWGQKWFSLNGELKLSLALSLAPAMFLWQRLNEMNGFPKGPAPLCHCCIIHLVSQGDLQICTFRTLICLFLLVIFIQVVILLALWDARRTHFLETVNPWTTFQKSVLMLS